MRVSSQFLESFLLQQYSLMNFTLKVIVLFLFLNFISCSCMFVCWSCFETAFGGLHELLSYRYSLFSLFFFFPLFHLLPSLPLPSPISFLLVYSSKPSLPPPSLSFALVMPWDSYPISIHAFWSFPYNCKSHFKSFIHHYTQITVFCTVLLLNL